MADTRGAGFSLDLHWVAGHEGATWNELTDARAKQAAQGYSSHSALLPGVLRAPSLKGKLPASKSAVLQQQRADLHKQWTTEWMSSPRYGKLRTFVPSLPYKGFLELTASRSKAASAAIFRFRTRHTPLNQHLHRIGSAETPLCPGCLDGDETVQHFIYECPEYDQARQALRRAAGRAFYSMAYLLSDKKGTRHFLQFLRATGRIQMDPRAQPRR
ncbi:hypothetical protein K488DRAFT_66613 [Vararia minispora EC-137]|uniref:Uncharacterized protein n=1 Tax=Vararia minispora EC-137 TaxID=1314806 RepID=A0ACB8Q4S3_9AGAM|nr:hypothetical protein K488DRAFT_66613 [Vararia minispora EC-137]